MKKRAYNYDEFEKDVHQLAQEVKEFAPESIIAIARGGLTLGHCLAQALHIRDIQSINAISYNKQEQLTSIMIKNIPNITTKKVLVVDDIADSGQTLNEVMKLLQEQFPLVDFKTATIFYKTTARFEPEFKCKEAKQWIEFFWESY